ncbi:MAG: alpha/beta hydrolase [Acidimicrobiales bacterium]|nr:alpha/beta hydrolase [Acidimicrobiales bacterium]
MASDEHEHLVAAIVAGGMRTPELRPSAEEFEAARASEALDDASAEAHRVAWVDANGVPCAWVEPSAAANGSVVLFFHGGGYIWMSPRTHAPLMAALADASGARFLGVHYRRAPEHPYPAAVDDAVSAYAWVLGTGVRPDQIVLAGDSAGGGLAIATLVALRDLDMPLPAGATVISPWVDLAVAGDTADSIDDPVVSGDALRMMAEVYLAGADPRSPTASPLHADLSGLPAIQIQVGTRESLLADARRLAQHARDCGVDTELVEHRDVIHMWVVFDPTIPESVDAIGRVARFVVDRSGAER